MHQFDKVEMFSFVAAGERAPSTSGCWRSRRRSSSELEIPYRVVDIAVDDLGASAARKFDCEAWMPGQGRYREVTSTSNTTDFQARRLDIRHRPPGGEEARAASTRSTAPRSTGAHMIALLENGQRDDGSVALPASWLPFGAPAELPRPSRSRRLTAGPRPAKTPSCAGPRPDVVIRDRFSGEALSAASRVGSIANVVSSRVISNSRSTVGLAITSASAAVGASHPALGVEQHAEAGRVDEVDRAEVDDHALPSPDRRREPLSERGAVLRWISPAATTTSVRSSGRSSLRSSLGESKATPLATEPARSMSSDQRMCTPEIARAITNCWISAVPSKMS